MIVNQSKFENIISPVVFIYHTFSKTKKTKKTQR